MTDPSPDAALHWFWTGFFVFYGAVLIVLAKRAGNCVGSSFVTRTIDESLRPRVRAILCKRGDMESPTVFVKYATGISSFVCALLCAFSIAQPGLLYGVVVLIGAAAMSVGFLRLRNRQPVRVAILSRRSPESIVPPVWIALAVVQGLIALAALEVPSQAAAAIFVCISTVACGALAWRVTEMPALLSGDDVALEEFVDMRLRQNRVAAVLYMAFVQTFVFISQLEAQYPSTTIRAAYLAATLLWLAYTVWFMFRFFGKGRFTAAPA